MSVAAAQPLERGDTAELGHVQVDDDGIRIELLGEPERLEAVEGDYRRP